MSAETHTMDLEQFEHAVDDCFVTEVAHESWIQEPDTGEYFGDAQHNYLSIEQVAHDFEDQELLINYHVILFGEW